MTSHRFVIHAPLYSRVSAGVRALWHLGYELEDRGHDVSLHAMGTPAYPTAAPRELHRTYRDDPGAVNVYPEIVDLRSCELSGTTLLWLLAPARFPIPNGCHVFAWSHRGGHTERLLRVDLIEPQWFFPKRRGPLLHDILTYRGKGSHAPTPSPASIDPGARVREVTADWPETRAELGQVLRESSVLLSADPYSQLLWEASVCGTPSLVTEGLPDGIPGVRTCLRPEGALGELLARPDWYDVHRARCSIEIEHMIQQVTA